MPHARALLGAVLTVAALAAAGCGSSSSTNDDKTSTSPAKTTTAAAATPTTTATPATTATGPAPSRAAYVRRADKVCLAAREVSASANAVVQKAFAANDLNKAAEAIDNYTPLYAQRIADLKALPRPKADGKILSGLIKVLDGQVQALHDEASALRQQDNTTLQTITKAQQTELQFAEELGKQYGFRVCGRA